ncbi:hypothetical protein BD779DRAFT_1662928 [Infundibulicybe gibba]|nr:hypothetical protein BD779DRAFT_1662928 [Infundibulicybe gibba]
MSPSDSYSVVSSSPTIAFDSPADMDSLGQVITRHSEFWYSDGSIITIVENTSFRIHQSILSRHSDVFADLFAVPQPDNAEQIDECPTVHLPDSFLDFEDTMKALYRPFHFDSLPANADLSTIITFISGMLRISTKYNLHFLRKKCISVLQKKFPSTLAECDALLASQYQYLSTAVVRAIPLAREANVPEILPWAFYISTHIDMDLLLQNEVLSWRDKALSPTMKWRDTEALRVGPHPLEGYTGWPSLSVCSKCTTHLETQHKIGREKVWAMLPNMFQLGKNWDEIRKDQNR